MTVTAGVGPRDVQTHPCPVASSQVHSLLTIDLEINAVKSLIPQTVSAV